MTTKTPTTEKILSEALELHEKGVSLHSIVRTYPEHKAEIEELFGTLATLSLEKEKVRVPASGLERLLASLPEMEPIAPVRAPVKSPFTVFVSSIRMSSLKFVLPLAALAILTGGFALNMGTKDAPIVAVAPEGETSETLVTDTARSTGNQTAPTAKQVATAPAVTEPAPAAMTMAAMSAPPASETDRMVAAFHEESAKEAEIAKQNDAQTNDAVAKDKALATDPTQAYED